MRNLKKVLSLVLCMAMMLSVMVIGAGASYNTFKDQDKIENQEAVFLLNALDIVEGRETGNFDPAANINRAEAAKLVAALNLAGVPVPNAKGVSSFSDVLGDGSVAWANNYIEYCVSQGSVNGMGDGTFAPKADVTGVQFAKMLLGILGYDAVKEGYVGTNWMYNVNIDAVKAKLYVGLDKLDVTAPLSRDDAAQMMYNALKAFPVIYLTDTTGALKITGKDLLSTIYPTVYGNDGVMTGIKYDVDEAEYTYTISVTFKDGTKNIPVVSDVDYTEMLGMNVLYVVDKVEGTLGLYAYENGAVDTGLLGDFDTDSDMLDKDTKFVNFESDGNDVDLTKSVISVVEDLEHCYYEYKAIDNDNDGDYDYVIIYPVYMNTVTAVGSDSISLKNPSGKVDCDKNTIYSGVAAKDEVTVEYDTTLKTVYVINELPEQSGKVDSFRGDSNGAYEVTISGKTYDVSCEMARKIDTHFTGKYVNFQVINGYVVDIAVDNSVAFSQFLMVTSIDDSRNLDGSYTAQALMADGSTAEIDISKLVGYGTEKNIYKEISKYLEQRLPTDYDPFCYAQRGYVAKYDVVDGKYELTPLHMLPGDAMGFDHSSMWVKFNAAADNTKNATMAFGGQNYKIADDAVIFLADVSGEKTTYSVVSGADIKHITGLTTVFFAGTEYDEATGYSYVTFAHVVTNNMSKSADVTGILTSDVKVYSGTDAEYAYFTMWDGEKDVTMNGKLDSMVGKVLSNLDAGTVITFSVDKGMIVEIRPAADGYTAGAVTKYAADSADEIYIDNVRYPIADDAQIFFYDTSEKVGVADGQIALGTLKDATVVDGERYNNVAYVVEAGEIVLMIVDNDIDGDIITSVLY